MDDPPTPPPPPPNPTPDVFSVSRRFDLATILVAMLAYALLFAGMRLLRAWPSVIGVVGLFFTVVAAGQAVAIRWNNPRAASVVAGTLFWIAFAIVVAVAYGFGSSCEIAAALVILIMLGPILGYLAGALVGSVFLISHYLRETQTFRRHAPAKEEEADSPWSG